MNKKRKSPCNNKEFCKEEELFFLFQKYILCDLTNNFFK